MRSHHRPTTRLLASVLVLCLTLQGCGDEFISGIVVSADAQSDGGTPSFSGQDGTPTRHTDTGPAVTPPPRNRALKREIIPLLNNSVPQVIGPNAVLPINVKVIDYTSGGPAKGIAVLFEIEQSQSAQGGGGQGTLDAMATATNDMGLTGNVFRANKDPLVHYKLKISCEGAQSVFVMVHVTDTPKGRIRVTLTYDNQVQIGQAIVRVMPVPFTCTSFKPIYPTGGYVASKATFLGDKPEFNGLAANKKYGLYVIAKDTNGHLAAAGCADGILVIESQTTEVTVTLKTLTLLAAGPYDMVNRFDFTGAIPGQLGKILDTAVQIFFDPGGFIIAQVKNLIKQFIPSILVDAAFKLFEKQLAKVVTDWLLNNSPSWLQDFFTIGQDVLQIVKKLEMLGVLKIYKMSNDYFVKGDISFTGVNLYWKLGCDKKAPNFKDCGKVTFDLSKQVNDPNFPFDLLAGTFTGTISQQTKMTIDTSTIKLNYGKLILFVLTHVVLKKLTGETSFKKAMAKLINCAGIAKGIGKSILGKIGLKESTVKKTCESAVGLLVIPIEQSLKGLTVDSKLSLNGGCTMVDDLPKAVKGKDWDGDLKVDRLESGWWKGYIVSEGVPGKPFKGDFTAVRKDGF